MRSFLEGKAGKTKDRKMEDRKIVLPKIVLLSVFADNQ
jgi:hypothetical protein